MNYQSESINTNIWHRKDENGAYMIAQSYLVELELDWIWRLLVEMPVVNQSKAKSLGKRFETGAA